MVEQNSNKKLDERLEISVKQVNILSRFMTITTNKCNKLWAVEKINDILKILNKDLNDKIRRKSKTS